MAKSSINCLAVIFFLALSSPWAWAQTESADATTFTLPQPVRNLTLDEAIRTAFARHPSLRRAQEEILAAEARTEQARSGYFPQITTSGFAKQGLAGASGALGLRGLVTSPLFRDIGASMAALQNLYDFGRTKHAVRANKWLAVSLNHALEWRRALVALNVQQAYYTALQQQRLVKVGEQILADRQLIVRQASAFYRAEIKSKVDLTLAEVNASNANLELVEARDRLRTAFAELNYAMGIEGEPEYKLEEPRITIAAAPALAPLVAEGQQERHELLAFDAQIKADQEFVIRAEKDKWPKLLFLFSSGWVRFSDYSPGKLLLGAFGVDFPIFDGGRIEAQIAESKARLAETRAARDELAQNIRFQTERAYNELLSSIESVRANERLITQAREALRLANVRYRAQVGSFVELTSAEAAASSAEAQYAQALYKYKMAEATLNYVTGRSYKP